MRPKQIKPEMQSAGFTLIELLVVVVIIAILVSIAVPYMNDARKRAKETETAANLAEIAKGLEQFGTDNNGMYPFRIRWYDDTTYRAQGFDPKLATTSGTGMTSDADSWFSLGLIGGVRVVDEAFTANTNDLEVVRREHKVVQPQGWDPPFYRIFNQYSDPLVALGYLGTYPVNPFLRRPMGNIMWGFGEADNGRLNKTIPEPQVLPTPGDFVYTFFYSTDGTDTFDPPGVVEAVKSYQVKSATSTHQGMYYLDVVDSYQLWAYGILPMNGGTYVAYPNNSFGISTKGLQEAKKDYDNSGTRDTFEMGIISYYKRTGGGASQASDAQGNKVQY